MATKQKHRGHGEGSIYRRADGRWCAAISTERDATGKVKRQYIYGLTRKQVADELTKALVDRQHGIPLDPTRQTTAQFLTHWLEDTVRGRVALNTYEAYRTTIEKHLIPGIGSIPLAKLTPQHLQNLYREKQDTGLTRRVQMMHAILHKALDQAVKWGLAPRNVCDLVDGPRVARREMKVLSPPEVGRFLEAGKDDRLFALFVLAVTTGLRLGEVLGLKWGDVDMTEGMVQVQRSLQWGKVAVEGEPGERAWGYYFTEPKTARSRRTVVLPEVALTALRKHRIQQVEERLKLGEVWEDHGLVFTTGIGTPLDPSQVRTRSFHPLLEKAGLPRIRFHDLRHTAATLLLAAGENPKVIQEMLGHSSISMTLDRYSHVIPSMQRQAAAKMDAILKAGRPS